MAKSVDPDQASRTAASDLDLYCLLRYVCSNTWIKYGNLIKLNPLRKHPRSAPGKYNSYYEEVSHFSGKNKKTKI